VNRKILYSCLIVFLCSVILVNFGVCYSPNATIPFGLDELSGEIAISSPIENLTYTNSAIAANVGLHIGGIEYEPNTHYVPYQNFICVYSLDGSEWQNMSFVSVGGHEAFSSMVNPYWYSNTWLNYTATLYNISNGTHLLRFDVKPDSLSPRVRSISSLDKASVNFTISILSNPTEIINPTEKAETTIVVPKNAEFPAMLSLVIGVPSLVGILLIYRRHRKAAKPS
jgi:hypothetical protein